MHNILADPHALKQSPAKATYDSWKNTLETWHGRGKLDPDNDRFQSILYGPDSNMGIGPTFVKDAPVNRRLAMSFGYVYNRSMTPRLTLLSNGEFRINHRMSSYQERDILSRSTFLRWSHLAREFIWMVGEGEGSYTPPNFSDPKHYVGERTIGMSYSYYGSAWLRLERVNDAWEIRFSRKSQERTDVTQEAFDKFDRLREFRYKREERQHLIATGAIKPNAPRTKLTPEEQQERFDKAAQALTGLMAVTTRTTQPMKKKEDA